jgi:hypothetical protein
MVATEWFPVTGGLFLGQDAQSAAVALLFTSRISSVYFQ